MAVWIKMPFGTGVGLSPGHIVLDGDPAPQKGAQQPAPYFSAHVYFGILIHPAVWPPNRWMPFGTEVGLRPGHIVLDRDPAPLPKRVTAAPTFRPMSVVAIRLDRL